MPHETSLDHRLVGCVAAQPGPRLFESVLISVELSAEPPQGLTKQEVLGDGQLDCFIFRKLFGKGII